MNVKTLAIAGAVTLTSVASADFVGATIVDATVATGAPSGTVYQVYANFDSPTDQLIAISGNTNVAILSFSATAALLNDGGGFSGLKSEDFALSPLGPAWDSHITIGATGFIGDDTDYSPGFLNNDGATRVIEGSSWSDSNDGYFDSNPGTPVLGTSSIIAQFWLPEGADFSYSGTVDWQPGPGQLQSVMFSVTTVPVPAPGVLALLGLAGLAGSRRRRG